jgi:hypothetical protein
MTVANTYSNYHTITPVRIYVGKKACNTWKLKDKKVIMKKGKIMAFPVGMSDMKTFPPDRQIFPGLSFKTGKYFYFYPR